MKRRNFDHSILSIRRESFQLSEVIDPLLDLLRMEHSGFLNAGRVQLVIGSQVNVVCTFRDDDNVDFLIV